MARRGQASARSSNSAIENMHKDCNPNAPSSVEIALPLGLMVGPVLEAARVRFFFGFAALRQERFYRPPNFLHGGALTGTFDGRRNRSSFAHRSRNALLAA